MKNNQRLKLTLFLGIFLCFSSTSNIWAQTSLGKMSKVIQRALNNYIQYGNELVHTSNVMHEDFNYVNLYFKDYIEKKTENVPALGKPKSVLDEQLSHPMPLEELFEKLQYDNTYIHKEKRQELLELAQKSRIVVLELEEIYEQLYAYVNNPNTVKEDMLFEKGFKMLNRVEVLYYDLYQLQEKIHWQVSALANRYQRTNLNTAYVTIIQRFNVVLEYSKMIIRLSKTEEFKETYKQQLLYLKQSISDLENNAATYLHNIPLAEDSEFCPHQFYRSFLAQAMLFLAAAETLPTTQEYKDLVYPNAYYLYNFQLFPKFNRYGDGLTILFNKFIDLSGEYFTKGIEFPLYYKVIYPKVEAYAHMHELENIDSLLQANEGKIDSFLAAKEQAKQVSDTTPSMQGFPTNNLVFLLDVSISMNSPEKLPLLKSALFNLLDVMRQEDNITIVTYSGAAKVLLPPTPATDRATISAAIEQIKYSTLTDADLGIQLAYKTAKNSFIKQGNNRIVLATDGKFKLSKSTEKLIKKQAKKNLSMSIFYFSAIEYKETKAHLEALSKIGNGSYRYVEPNNANTVFLEEAQGLRE